MYNFDLVPEDFVVPDVLHGDGYILRMLSIEDLEKDFEAVVASAGRIRGLFDPTSSWPDGLTKKEDLIDLAWHQREFTVRHSFAYTVMASDESRCLGCVYIFPSKAERYDAAVFYWVRDSADADIRDAELGARLRAWLASDWPFASIAFPGRDIPWPDWRRLQRATSAQNSP
jgi:hypothetical protein